MLEYNDEIEIVKGRYKGCKNCTPVFRSGDMVLVKTSTTDKGGKFQEHFGGHIVKVTIDDIQTK